MKRFVVLVLVCSVLSVVAFADKKPKKSKINEQKVDTTLVVKNQQKKDSVKLSVTDSLQMCADSLLSQLKTEKELVTPHLNAFMSRLMDSDTISAHHDEFFVKFGAKVIRDLKTLRFKNDSIHRQFVAYYESLDIMSKIQETLSNSYNVTNIELAEQQLITLGKYKLNSNQRERVDVLSKGVKYYKNRIAIRRVGDIIDELYELKADSVRYNADSLTSDIRDSLFSEIINHQGRNHLIDYVPYAVSLRQKIVDAFPYDSEKHVLFEKVQWDCIEVVRKEIQSILEK